MSLHELPDEPETAPIDLAATANGDALPTGRGYAPHPELPAFAQTLDGVAPVAAAPHRRDEVVLLVFREAFCTNAAQYMNRAGWTYHTAFALRTAAQLLGLRCHFERGGRLDGLVEDRAGQRVLAAEWEHYHRAVFGVGNELEKLREATHAGGSALLFSYCPLDAYAAYLRAVVVAWHDGAAPQRASLFLMLILYETTSGRNHFRALRTVEIGEQATTVWDDIALR